MTADHAPSSKSIPPPPPFLSAMIRYCQIGLHVYTHVERIKVKLLNCLSEKFIKLNKGAALMVAV